MEICPKCGLPKDLCVCEQIAREQQELRVWAEKRRYGKMMTIVGGIEESASIVEVARQLKGQCASGGTIKDGRIEIQGNHKERVCTILRSLGFNVECL